MSEREVGNTDGGGLNRRSFVQRSGGVATGLAVAAVPSAATLAFASPAAAKESGMGELVHPQGDMPDEPVMAYVHDAEKGEVTVVQGTVERSYRDPALAKRLLDAARGHNA